MSCTICNHRKKTVLNFTSLAEHASQNKKKTNKQKNMSASVQLFQHIREIGESLGVSHISENAVQPIFSTDDPELTLALCRGAITIAASDGLKTLMIKHAIAAYALYNLVCDEMAIKAPKLTKVAMRARAISESKRILQTNVPEIQSESDDKVSQRDPLTKVSPAAIDLIYNKEEQQISHIKWSISIYLASVVMKETKTLQVLHAETAKSVLDHLTSAIDIVTKEEDEQGAEEIEEDEK